MEEIAVEGRKPSLDEADKSVCSKSFLSWGRAHVHRSYDFSELESALEILKLGGKNQIHKNGLCGILDSHKNHVPSSSVIWNIEIISVLRGENRQIQWYFF